MVDPTWPAPMTKTRTGAQRTSAHGSPTHVGYRAAMRARARRRGGPLRRRSRLRLRVGARRRGRVPARRRRAWPLGAGAGDGAAQRATQALRRRAARDDSRRRATGSCGRGSSSTCGAARAAGGEQGLLGLAFDPQYASNRFIYVNYTDTSGDTRVVRYRTNGTRALPATARVLLAIDQPYSNHNGGGLAFGPDGGLYVGTGDGGSGGDPENRAQNMDSAAREDAAARRAPSRARRPRSSALGLRNPWRYSFDRLTGDLYIADVGQGAVEEVDYTPRSSPGLENYGWDVYEGSSRFEDKGAGPGELVFPIYEYSHDRGCTVVGGYRLSRVGAEGRAWALRLRRLLLGHHLEPAHDRRQGDRRARRAVHDPEPHVLRRERRGRALRDVTRSGDPLPASPELARPSLATRGGAWPSAA